MIAPKSNIVSVFLLITALFISCSESDILEPNKEEKEIIENTEFAIYSDTDYPSISNIEIPASNQRFVGGANASDSNNGSKNLPWATLNKALQELCKSNTWYCLNLLSDIKVDSFIDTKYYGPGPGTASQFVYIRSEPSLASPATLILNARVEIDGQQNWLWHNFKMTGPEGINLGQDLKTNHHTVRNISGTMTGAGGDNHGFFQALNYNANYFGVFNCNFTGPGLAGIHGNTATIIAFRITHMRIENNVFTNAPRPLYYKHSNRQINGKADIHIRYNYQPEMSPGESCFFAGRAEGGIFEIVDNIFGGNVEISNGGGSEQPEGHTISHNTFLKDLTLKNGNDPVINASLKNNIILGNLELLRYYANSNTNTSNYELIAGNVYYQSEVYTLAQWQKNAVPSNQDINSVAGTPTFSGDLLKPKDYKLKEGSIGKAASSNGDDLGARVFNVGNN